MFVDPGWYEAYWFDRQTARRAASTGAQVVIGSVLIGVLLALLRHFGPVGI